MSGFKELTTTIAEKYQNIHSCLIGNSDQIFFEKYFPGEDGRNGFIKTNRNYLHDLRSATKSVTSILVGIAYDKKLISLDDPITKYLSGWVPNNRHSLENIKIIIFSL